MTAAAIAVLLAAGVLYLWFRRRARRLSSNRLATLIGSTAGTEHREEPPSRTIRSFPPRYPFAAYAAGLVTAAVSWLVVGLPVEVAAAAGILAGVLAYLVEDHVGGPPLRPYFQEVAGRIRLGDDPRTAVSDLQLHVPLETFRLFATSLAIHWEVGGSLATTLSTVGQTVRDRIELSRRVRAQSVESHASVGVVMLIAYILAFLMWRTNPDRLEAFVRTGVGTALVAGVITLQAVGLVWMSKLTRSTF